MDTLIHGKNASSNVQGKFKKPVKSTMLLRQLSLPTMGV